MSYVSILAPVFALVLLTFVLLIATGRKRLAAVRAGDVKIRDIALGQRNWPDHVAQCSNAFDNQFQIPVLFYVLTAFAMITKQADLVFVIMAWIFVALRALHAWIYVTTNNIRNRFNSYLAGVLVLMLMWLLFALEMSGIM